MCKAGNKICHLLYSGLYTGQKGIYFGYCSKAITKRSCVLLIHVGAGRHTAVHATQHCEYMDGGGMCDR